MKKLKGLIIVLMISLSLFGICGCQGDGSSVDTNTATNTDTATTNTLDFEQITPEKAKKIMDGEEDYILIDSRTQEEYDSGHIEGAIMIPEYEIADKAEVQIPDKDALILVYCRSGRRSKIASQALADLGYTNVKEFGGIIDWPYEIVQ